MAKTGVKSNIPKAMREFQLGFDKLQRELMNREASLVVMVMDEIREKGLVKGEQTDKGYYQDIKQSVPGIISYTKPLKRGGRSKPRKIFAKNRIAVRKSKLFKTFEHNKNFTRQRNSLVQNRTNAKIEIDGFTDGTKTITFSFFGRSGRILRLLSYGQKRTQKVTTSEGKELKGRKGRRDVIRSAIRKIFVGRHNKALQKYVNSDYARDFRKIK